MGQVQKLFFLVMVSAYLLITTTTSFATELLGPEVGNTPFGMGRAYSAVADDDLSLHYNPAGLALVKKIDLQIFDFNLETNNTIYNNYKKFSKLSKAGTDMADKVNAVMDKHLRLKMNNLTQITVPYFAMAVYYDNTFDFDTFNPVYPEAVIRYTKDLSFMGGFGASLGKKNNFRYGSTIKLVKRTGGIKTFTIAELTALQTNIAGQFTETGTGIGVDTGVQYTLPLEGRTDFTLSWVWHDIGDTSFGNPVTVDRPTAITANMIMGAALRLPIGGTVNRRKARRMGGQPRSINNFTVAFDYSHLNISTDKEPFAKHTHFGMNLDLPVLSIQLGLNQALVTGGIDFDLLGLKVSATTYAEELGYYVGQRPDRRYMLSVAWNISAGKLR